MKILIIENELSSANQLAKLIKQYDSALEIVDILTNVADSIEWFSNKKNKVDLIFQSPILSDGDCFGIFKTLLTTYPVIFTLDASNAINEKYRMNNIDYILRDYSYASVQKVLEKYSKFTNLHKTVTFPTMDEVIMDRFKKIIESVVISVDGLFKTINTRDIAYIQQVEGATFLHLFDGEKLPIDRDIATLEVQLDQVQFYRVNPDYIINSKSIAAVNPIEDNHLSIKMSVQSLDALQISEDKVAHFKEWMDQ